MTEFMMITYTFVTSPKLCESEKLAIFQDFKPIESIMIPTT